MKTSLTTAILEAAPTVFGFFLQIPRCYQKPFNAF